MIRTSALSGNQGSADNLAYYEVPISKHQDQATDRAHRIGQTRDVTVFKLIAKDTIEEKILRLQESKKELADAVLTGETRSLGSMSKEELLELIS